MKIADFLGQEFNLFSKTKKDKQSIDEFVGDVENRPNASTIEAEDTDQADTKTMVAPLQQKLELLKKAVDVDSYYDNDKEEKLYPTTPVNLTLNIPQGQSTTKIDLTINGEHLDELDKIKKIAGIPTATIFDAGDDEPLDS
jgi:hypothetical protein